MVERVLNSESVDEMRAILDDAFERYDGLEAAWKASVLTQEWIDRLPEAGDAAAKLDKLIEADRAATLQTMSDHAAFLRK